MPNQMMKHNFLLLAFKSPPFLESCLTKLLAYPINFENQLDKYHCSYPNIKSQYIGSVCHKKYVFRLQRPGEIKKTPTPKKDWTFLTG
jgi:hypothetical protein